MNPVNFAAILMTIAMFNVETSQSITSHVPLKRSRCDKIPQQCVDYTMMILMSPFSMMRTNLGKYNCSHVTFVGDAQSKIHYTGSIILINKEITSIYDCTLHNDTTFFCKDCGDEIDEHYSRVVYYNLKSKSRASLCVVVCDNSGKDTLFVECFGRTAEDKADIDKFLSTLTPLPVSTIYHSQQFCDKSQHCALFP